MPSNRLIIGLILCAGAIATPAASRATILLFTDTGFPVSQTYGDNADGPQGGKYSKGRKWTPHVKASYATVDIASQTVVSQSLYPYDTSYGDLHDIVYTGDSGVAGEITLKAATGYVVRILDFDLAGFLNHDVPNQPLQIVNGKRDTVLENLGPLTVAGYPHTTIEPAYGFAKKLRLQFSNTIDVGLDNFHFTEKADVRMGGSRGVPEPGAWTPLVAVTALGVWLLCRRRSRELCLAVASPRCIARFDRSGTESSRKEPQNQP